VAPDSVESYCNLGNAFKDSGQYEKALDNYKHAIQLRPGFAEAHFNCAMVHLLNGNFTEGWREYEWRLRRKEWKALCPNRANLPRWNGESFVGKKLLIYDEQGFGDTLQFVRYLPFVKNMGGEVIFETRRELIRLLSDFQGADDVIEKSSYDKPAEEANFYISLLSLPGIFKTSIETIPNKVRYLFSEQEKEKYWRKRLNEKNFKVGIVWAGRSTHKDDHHRSCVLDHFKPLFEIPGIELIGLQKGSAAALAAKLASRKGFANFGEVLEDFADTAGLIQNLDLVISVDTAVAHLAGAMGKPVWVLLPYVADWRWFLDRNDSPWYPTMRLFRQKKRGCWDEALQYVADEISQWVHQRTASQNWIEENCK
jgi:tetratricopeptide (TPR) repeat protein